MKVNLSLVVHDKEGLNIFKTDNNGNFVTDDYMLTTKKILLKNVVIDGLVLSGEIISHQELEKFEEQDSIYFNLEYVYFQDKKVINKLLYEGSELLQSSYNYDYAIVELNNNGSVSIYANITENEKFITYNSLSVYNDINKDGKISPKRDGVKKTFIHVRHGFDGCASCSMKEFKQINYFQETDQGLLNVYTGVQYRNIKTLEQYAYGLKNDAYSTKHEIIRFGDNHEW